MNLDINWITYQSKLSETGFVLLQTVRLTPIPEESSLTTPLPDYLP